MLIRLNTNSFSLLFSAGFEELNKPSTKTGTALP